jgi:hypothetical protein
MTDAEPESESLRDWVAKLADACRQTVRSTESIDVQNARLEMLIEERLEHLSSGMLQELWRKRDALDRTRRLGAFEASFAGFVWAQGVREAVRVDQDFPAVMAHSRDPERYQIGKEWFESVCGAQLGQDLVELSTEINLPRRMIVTRVMIQLPPGGTPEQAFARLEGRVVRPYQISKPQQFYPGDVLRRIDETELRPAELRALNRVRASLTGSPQGDAQ